MRRSASLLGSDDHGRNIGRIDRGVVKFGTGELREVHQLVADLFNFSADLFSGLHSQLDNLPDIFLENSQDGIAGLEINLPLSEEVRRGEGNEDGDEK